MIVPLLSMYRLKSGLAGDTVDGFHGRTDSMHLRVPEHIAAILYAIIHCRNQLKAL